MSSSHDDTILIWDFLDPTPPDVMEVDTPSSVPYSPDAGSSHPLGDELQQDSDTAVDELDDRDIQYPIQESLAHSPSLPSPPTFNHHEGGEAKPIFDLTHSPS